jgi:transposase
MRHVRDVIRLKSAGMPIREIARRMGTAPSTVRLTIRRFEAAGLTWPLSDDITDTELEARLFASAGAGPGTRRGHRRQAEPDWAAVHRELRRKHVTLSILWEEYIAGEPEGYRYSRFCELYRGWEGRLSVTMRQSHAAGDKLFVDYAGDGVPVVIDRLTGAFEAIGGVPALLVPDNTKVAVIKACLYDPQINRSYADMAAHYGTAILPARPRRPRDKAKVEQAVLMVERWLLGRLRHRTFHSLADVNAAIAELLTRLNEERPIRRLGVTRRKLLEEIDRPALKALPESPYVFAEWRICRVSIDYHVEVEAHYYSVPHRFVRAEVEVRFTARTVEIFHKGERIAAHQRMSGNHKHTTVPEHMASSHRRYAGWTIERIRKDAAAIGPATAALCELILDERAHPEQGFRACLGIIRLARSYGQQRLDAAAMRAIDIGARTYGSVKSILANNLDRRPSPKRSADDAPILHPNIRGPRYYN